MSSSPLPLFVYGSLMLPEVLQVLIGRAPKQSPATAPGWRVSRLVGKVFPVLVPDPSSSAVGLVISGLTSEEWEILDRFEDPRYIFQRISLSNGEESWTYMIGEGMETFGNWDKLAFQKNELAGYLARCRAWTTYPPSTNHRSRIRSG